jgi:hypothetical protein
MMFVSGSFASRQRRRAVGRAGHACRRRPPSRGQNRRPDGFTRWSAVRAAQWNFAERIHDDLPDAFSTDLVLPGIFRDEAHGSIGLDPAR